MVSRISTKTLVALAAFGGMGVAGMGFYVMRREGDFVRQTPYYKEALRILEESPQAKSLLGDSIHAGRFEMFTSSSDCYCDGKKAHFQVPVNGPRAAATYWFWAERESDSESWKISRAELAPKIDETRRLVIVKEAK